MTSFSNALFANDYYLKGNPRLIVLTDIGNEPDDAESLIRLLVYANDVDIEGLVAATSRHLPENPNPELIRERVEAYGKVLSNLRKHDKEFPSKKHLLKKVVSGSPVYGMSGVGKGKSTAASQLIINAVDQDDPRPVWIAAWGGIADLAQALWEVRESRTPVELEEFVAKLRVYSISDQDDAGPWIRAWFPKLFWTTSVHAFSQYRLATWIGVSAPAPGADNGVVSKQWLKQNIQEKGALGALYPTPAYIMEGDTPSFLGLLNNGLNYPERPDWGNWGGRYGKVSDSLGLWTTTADQVKGIDGKQYSSPQATVWRWRPAFQNDFASRMQWSVTDEYEQANHAPDVHLNGSSGSAPVFIDTCPGEEIALSAKGSSDPDGDALSYRWWQYREASGHFAPDVSITSNDGISTKVTIGDTAQVDQFAPPSKYDLHIILEVRDNGTPALTRYRRAVISVPGGESYSSNKPCTVQPLPPVHLRN